MEWGVGGEVMERVTARQIDSDAVHESPRTWLCEGATGNAVSSASFDLISSFALRTLRSAGDGCSVMMPVFGLLKEPYGPSTGSSGLPLATMSRTTADRPPCGIPPPDTDIIAGPPVLLKPLPFGLRRLPVRSAMDSLRPRKRTAASDEPRSEVPLSKALPPPPPLTSRFRELSILLPLPICALFEWW